MCSATSHLGGKMTKSSNATPGLSVGAVNTAHGNRSCQKNIKKEQFPWKKKETMVMEIFTFIDAYQYWLMDHYDQTEPYYTGRICLNHTASKNNNRQIKMHNFFHRNYTRSKLNNMILITSHSLKTMLEEKITNLIWKIITMPSNNIEGREILNCGKEFTTKLLHYSVPRIGFIFKPCSRNKEIPWRSKTVSTLNIKKKLTFNSIYLEFSANKYHSLNFLRAKDGRYLLVPDQEVENEYQIFQQHSPAMDYQADSQKNENLEVV